MIIIKKDDYLPFGDWYKWNDTLSWICFKIIWSGDCRQKHR